MNGRVILACFLVSAAVALLLLFASGSSQVEATTFKANYSGELSCDGPDGNPGTGDDSCTDGTEYDAGVSADMKTNFDIPAPAAGLAHANFTKIDTFGIPATWNIARGEDLPLGAFAGPLVSNTTLSIANSPCPAAPNVVVTIPLFNCSTDNSPGNQVVWTGDGSNVTQDDDGDGLPNACNQYPRHVNTIMGGAINDGCPAYDPDASEDGCGAGTCSDSIDNGSECDGTGTDGADFDDSQCRASGAESGAQCDDEIDNDGDTRVNDGCPAVGTAETGAECDNALDDDVDGLKPRVRYYGYTNAVAGSPPTQINFVIMNTEQLSQNPAPESYLGDALGYGNFVILDNPIQAVTPSTITEFCTPLGTVTTLYGLTAGRGQNIPTEGANPELTAFCTGANVGVDNDADTVADDGCIVVTDACGDSTDNDGDGAVDEMCGLTRVSNPAANSGAYGTGSHIISTYAESQRDADGDGWSNNLDSCPFTATGAVADPTYGCDGCAAGTCTDGDHDGDTFYNRQDNCPLISNDQTDTDVDGIGDACDTAGNGPNSPDGPFLNDFPMSAVCIGEADGDNDGWCDSTETLLGSLPGVAASTPEYYGIDFTVTAAETPPGTAPGTCSNQAYYDTAGAGGAAVDDDGDTLTNAADLIGCGSSPVLCLNAVDDDGDTNVNDGCPAVGTAELPDCVDNVDQDGDGYINDGCPAKDAAETGTECDPGDVVDDDGDTRINDGCPEQVGASESPDCANATDDDADTVVNDGCPVKDVGEGTDGDGDGVVDFSDNCAAPPAFKAKANPEQLDTDGDGDGDACDTDDDNDGVPDPGEWMLGCDPKAVGSCGYNAFDLNGDGSVNVLDVNLFGPVIFAIKPGTP